MAEVSEITSIDDLEAYRLDWNDLWLQSRRRCLTGSLDWLMASWKAFGVGRQLKVLVVTVAERPIGFLPLACSANHSRWGSQRVLTNALRTRDTSGCVIGPNTAATYLAAMRYLANCRSQWDTLEINGLDSAGELSRCQAAMQWTQLFRTKEAKGSYFELDLHEPLEVNEQSKTSCPTSQVELEHYAPRGVACGDGVPDWNMLKQCFEIDQTCSTVNAPEEFRWQAFAIAVKHGMLDLAILKVDREPVAYWYGHRTEQEISCQAVRRKAGEEFAGTDRMLLARHLAASARRGVNRCRMNNASVDHTAGYQMSTNQLWQVSAVRKSLVRRSLTAMLELP